MVWTYNDEELGPVWVYTRRGARRIIAKWCGAYVRVTAPEQLTHNEVKWHVAQMREGVKRLKSQTPVLTYTEGQVVKCYRCEVTIGRDPRLENRYSYICAFVDAEHAYVNLPPSADLADEDIKRGITQALLSLMERIAPRHLLPLLNAEAKRLGIALADNPLVIGRGLRKMGHCEVRNRRIQLSRALMFLPEHLIRYIICHELAHLQHANHSPAFHQVVDSYTGGRERELESELRAFEWPILR